MAGGEESCILPNMAAIRHLRAVPRTALEDQTVDLVVGDQTPDGNIYDFPKYFDLLFADETQREADFIQAACQKYATRPVKRLLEPGCGGGRLIIELARRGFDVIGFDRSQPALEHLRSELKRKKLTARILPGDLSEFRLDRTVDAAYCTFNTFRHLLSEESAASHLHAVARALRSGGVYVLGFHLLPLDVDEECVERWTAQKGQTRVTCTLRVLSADRRKRLEQIRLSMLVRKQDRVWRMRTEFPLRMYTARQFRRLLQQVPELELCDVFDFWYEIDSPLPFDDQITDSVFVLRKK
jgi:SAM-dependent methyltransferase